MTRPDRYANRRAALEPFCAALRAYHDGDSAATIRLRSSLGEDEHLPAGVFFRAGDSLFPFERYAIELCRGTVLDLGAGAGVHSLELQSRGIDVLAVENASPLVDIMRARGVRDVLRADFRWFSDRRFDTALMLMNGIGPVGTLDGLDRFLAHAHGFLAPGGQLLVDSAIALPKPVSATGRMGAWPPAGTYSGQAWIDLEFAGTRGRPFRELYLDLETFMTHAYDAGWRAEVAFEDGGAFLMRLRRP